MILDEHFKRIVILSLPGAEARAERALRELREKNLSDTATVVQAVAGKVCKPPAWWTAGSGAWGCMQSHYRVVQQAVMDGIESVLLIEDDCVWESSAAELAAEFLKQVPDGWGQLYFGGQHRIKHGRPAPVAGKPAVVKARSVHRTHAYAIHQRAMVRFLQHIIHAPDYVEALEKYQYKSHFDHQLEKAHREGHWPVYAPAWWLAGQGANLSSISHREQREQWWQQIQHDVHRRVPVVICDVPPSLEQGESLHFGKHLRAKDPTWDEGVQSSPDADGLVRVMEVISKEAIEHRRLAGITLNPERPELLAWLRDRWPGQVIELSNSPDLEALRDFPGQRLFRHDWWNPVTPHLITGDEASESTDATAAAVKPKVHQIWIGGQDLPPRLAGYCDTVRRAFPDWEHHLWSDEDLPALAEKAILPEPLLDSSFPLGMRTDIMRLEILRQHGGVYLDTDFEALRQDLRPVFGDLERFCYGDELSGRPSNAMMGAPANHPFVEFYLRRIGATLHVPKNLWATVGITGPGKLSECLNLWVGNWNQDVPFKVGEERLGSIYAGGSIQSLWQETFYPYHYLKGTWATFNPAEFPKAWAAHHWEGGWNREP